MKHLAQYNRDPHFKAVVMHAVDLHKENNRSDPFAANRMHLHIVNGIENAVDVIKAEASRKEHAR